MSFISNEHSVENVGSVTYGPATLICYGNFKKCKKILRRNTMGLHSSIV